MLLFYIITLKNDSRAQTKTLLFTYYTKLILFFSIKSILHIQKLHIQKLHIQKLHIQKLITK